MRTTALRRWTAVVAVTLLCGLTTAVGTAGPAAAVLATPGFTETLNTCHSTTAVMYGNRMPCRQGAIWDRIQSGSYDETFAIRDDGAVMHTWPGHHGWSPVKNGFAANVQWATLWTDRSRTVCVETSDGTAYESRYNPTSYVWGTFHRGCAM